MDELEKIIKQTVNEVMARLQEYGPEWNSKLDEALTELENRMTHPQREDTPFEELLLNIQTDYGLSNYETFLVGENSTYPTDDEFWKKLGPQFAELLGKYPEDHSIHEEKPAYGDQINTAYKKATKEKNAEAMVYYTTLGNTSASVPFEQFKGSWAYGEWIKNPKVISAIQRVEAELKRFSWYEGSDLPLGGDEKYIKQQQSQEAPMPMNVAGPPSCFGEDAGEKVETKLISSQGTAYFHNHGCIVANHSNIPVKAICTEMEVSGQRSYYVRLDEA